MRVMLLATVVLALTCSLAGASVATEAVVDIGAFITETFTEPAGIGTEFVMGSEANAMALTFASPDVAIPLRIANIESMYVSGNLGFTFAVDEIDAIAGVDGKATTARDFQPVGGATIRITNIKGTELRLGVQLVDSSISERKLETPWFEIPYAWTVVLSRPILRD